MAPGVVRAGVFGPAVVAPGAHGGVGAHIFPHSQKCILRPHDHARARLCLAGHSACGAGGSGLYAPLSPLPSVGDPKRLFAIRTSSSSKPQSDSLDMLSSVRCRSFFKNLCCILEK